MLVRMSLSIIESVHVGPASHKNKQTRNPCDIRMLPPCQPTPHCPPRTNGPRRPQL